MKIINNSKSQRIKKAAIKDGIGYIIGFSPVPIPLSTIWELIKVKKKKSPDKFVDWELENWIVLYKKELDLAVKLPYKGENYFLPQILVFDNTEHNLDISRIIFRCKGKFKLREDIRALTEEPFEKLFQYVTKKRRYSNEENLRLIDIFKEGKRVIFEVQGVNYKHYLHTNLVLDAKSKRKHTLREWLHPEGKLEKLKNSPLANNLGVNILLFTADGSLIMQKRSKKVAFRSGELCPSASGTMALIDMGNDSERSLASISKLREAFEELGIFKSDIPSDQIIFLGVTRELIRGGEPEMFFFGKTNLSEKELAKRWEDARDKWESKTLDFFHFGKIAFDDLNDQYKVHKYLSSIDAFFDRHINKAGVTLLTNIVLWVKYRVKCMSSS